MSAHGSGLPRHICDCSEPRIFNNGFMRWCGRCGGIVRYSNHPVTPPPTEQPKRCYCGGPEQATYGHEIGSGKYCQTTEQPKGE
jgi:hypothetical protein